MTRHRSKLHAFLCALAAAAVALLAPAFASADPAPIAKVRTAGSAVEALDYWTPARMRRAEPVVPVMPEVESAPAPAPAPESGGAPTVVPPAAPGSDSTPRLLRGSVGSAARGGGKATLVGDPAAPKVRTHGKIFFSTVGGSAPDDYVCSGTVINSRNRSLVLTAGHCVYDAESGGGASVNLVFVPAYRGGEMPYGVWAAKSLAYPAKWKRDASLSYDIGAAVMQRNEDGQRLQSITGARGVGFDQPRDQKYRAFGYPVEGRFLLSQDEYQCRSGNRGSDVPASGPSTIKIACDMTGGASGGGWIARGKSLVSVTSYYYASQPGFLYGPYFSSTAKALYKKVRGSGAA